MFKAAKISTGIRLLVVLTGTILLSAKALAGPAVEAHDPRDVGARVVENLLGRDFMMYNDEALHYSEAAAAVGALRFAQITGDDVMRDRLVERYLPLLDDDSGLVSRRPHVDMHVIGIVPLQVAILTGDPEQRAQGLSFADSQWADPFENGLTRQTRWWIDDLYMVGMLQIQAYRTTNEPVYAERAALQLSAYLPRLQQDNGLFHHGPGAPVFWGRGNGWVASAMAEVLASLPRDDPQFDGLLKNYRAMMETLLRYQGQSGLWRQIIDDPDAWDESSSTAMFAYAMAVGRARGLLDDARYDEAVREAWQALADLTDAGGRVAGVCVGTGKSPDRDYYLARPRVDGDFHGQAPVLWLAVELMEQAARAEGDAANANTL